MFQAENVYLDGYNIFELIIAFCLYTITFEHFKLRRELDIRVTG